MVRRVGRRPLIAVAVALVVVATSITVIVVSESGSTQGAIPTSPLYREIQSLQTPNGFYVDPQVILDKSLSAYDSAYALEAVPPTSAQRHTPLSASTVAELRSSGITQSPLWGRLYLAEIEKYAGFDLLTASDLAAVQQMATAKGPFVEPGTPPDGDPPTAISATFAALSVLRQGGVTVTGTQRSATTGWLTSMETPAMAEPLLTYELAQSLTDLGAPVPDALFAASTAWYDKHTGSTGSLSPTTAVGDLYGLAEIRAVFQRGPTSLSAFWTPVFTAALNSTDMQDLAHAVVAAHIFRVAAAWVNPLVASIQRSRTASGLQVANPSYLGDLQTTDIVEQIQQQNGFPVGNAAVVTALRASASGSVVQSDPSSCLLWALVAHQTPGADSASADDSCAARAAAILVPAQIKEDQGLEWASLAWAAYRLHISVAHPTVEHWQLSSGPGVAAAATAVITAKATGDLAAFAWVSLDDLRHVLQTGQPVPDFEYYAAAALAYLDLGGSFSPSLRETIAAHVAAAKGCPGYPDLYRAAASDAASCDLWTTLVVDRLSQELASTAVSSASR